MKGPQSYLRRTGNSTGFHLTPSQSRDLQGTDVLFKDTPTRKCSPACATGQPLALALCSVRIEDEHGRPLAPGRSGKIAVRGPTTCAGYFNHPDDSARLLRGGWLHTGDSGRIDEAGRLWFLGRLPEKELIKSDGENVYPAEIEAALLEHPGIAQAVVIGVPDAQWGGGEPSRPLAWPGPALRCRPRKSRNSRVSASRYKRPRIVVFTPALPTKADGSIDREAVKQAHG